MIPQVIMTEALNVLAYFRDAVRRKRTDFARIWRVATSLLQECCPLNTAVFGQALNSSDLAPCEYLSYFQKSNPT